ncbi:MAG: hypothetical protein N2316_01300 [Spirochaetes bacterium]|nr:hypothetical protein [Spirochaetota bacterium]
MNINFFDIVTIFWIAALVWVSVEYFIYRHVKHQKHKSMRDAYKNER